LLCLFNLAGLPFTLGFFIKHILFACLVNDGISYLIISGFVILASLAGIIYCYRLYYYIFYDLRKAKKYVYEHANREDQKSIFYTVTTTASNIAILSLIVVGYMFLIYMYVTLFTKTPITESFDIVSVLPSSFKNLN
jgi:NADH:ubiquinone oxidoreductase subunit 2 (subunit N)